ncbi:MAG TPA: class I SAM-dependent methyltransferase [Pirellulaceae bacterium]|nr:class I SAM-dependent methyltransferase [Pirellulaceae bacterium]
MFHPRGPTFLELCRQALSSTERGYDLLAPKFDYTPFRTPDWALRAMLPHLEGRSFDRAVDLCCGTGAALSMIQPYVRELAVGIDLSRGMLAKAEDHLLASGNPNPPPTALVRGDARRTPFAGESFDLAVTFGALGHFLKNEEALFLSEVHRILRPGGTLMLATGYAPSALTLRYWIARTFNGVMHVRNALVRPPFVMFYLQFLLPGVRRTLERIGFDVYEHAEGLDRSLPGMRLVRAVKRG